MHPADRVLLRRQGLITRQQLDVSGVRRRAVERATRDGTLVRVRPGLYASSSLPVRGPHLVSGGVPDAGYVADVRGCLLLLGERAAAAGRTAAVLWGFDLVVEPTGVEVDVAPDRGRVRLPGVSVRRTSVGDVTELVVVPGTSPLRVTRPLSTVVACAMSLPLSQGVAVADSAMRRGLVRRDDLVEAVAARRGAPGSRRLAAVVRWCDPVCGSVLESLLRLLLAMHGLVPPRTQHVVRDSSGGFVGRVDLCWPGARLIVEADGRLWHDPDDARARDRRRGNDYARLGWRVLRFTWQDVVHHPDDVVATVRDALRSAAA